jgi:hypothetical protein
MHGLMLRLLQIPALFPPSPTNTNCISNHSRPTPRYRVHSFQEKQHKVNRIQILSDSTKPKNEHRNYCSDSIFDWEMPRQNSANKQLGERYKFILIYL